MTAIDSYHDLTDQGFNFWLDDGALKYRAPKGKMTADILAWLKASKKELISLLAKTNHHPKTEVKPVIQETVLQALDAQFEPLNKGISTTDLTHQLANQVENVSPHIEDGQLSPMEEVTPTWLMDRYAHLITCQQCEHLTLTGYCRVKPLVKPMPEAMHDCGEFNQLKTERISIVNKPYSKVELNDLLGRYEKPLFQHLVDCQECCLQDSHYCEDVFTIGSNYEDSLLCFDDAASKRESLLNAVVKARVTRRKVFVGYPNANVPPPC